MVDEQDRDYEVGYGRPPSETRFRAGQSGNPKGRRKGSKNLVTLVLQELDQRVAVNEGGKRRSMTKRETIAKQIVNGAAKADRHSLQVLLKMLPINDEPAADRGSQLNEDDRKTLDSFLARLKRGQGGGGSSDV